MSHTCTCCGISTNSTWASIHPECLDYEKKLAMATNDRVEVLPSGTITITVADREVNLFGEGAMEDVFTNLGRVAFSGGYKKTPSALFIRLDENGTLIGTRSIISSLWHEEIPADPEDSGDEGTPARFKIYNTCVYGGNAKKAQESFERRRQQWCLLRNDGKRWCLFRGDEKLREEEFADWSEARKTLADWFRELFRGGYLYVQRTKADGYTGSIERALSVTSEVLAKKRKALDDTIVPKFTKKRVSAGKSELAG